MERDVGSRWSLARVAAGVSRRARLLFPSRPRPAILMYHRIAHESFDPWALAVNPQNFARQLEWLSQDRVVLRLPEFAARHRDGSLPAEAVALTFDDGYACAAEVAAPLLEKFGLPATIFLPVDLIEAGALFWWDEFSTSCLVATARRCAWVQSSSSWAKNAATISSGSRSLRRERDAKPPFTPCGQISASSFLPSLTQPWLSFDLKPPRLQKMGI